jgi:hypothetical protein
MYDAPTQVQERMLESCLVLMLRMGMIKSGLDGTSKDPCSEPLDGRQIVGPSSLGLAGVVLTRVSSDVELGLSTGHGYEVVEQVELHARRKDVLPMDCLSNCRGQRSLDPVPVRVCGVLVTT